MASGASSPSGAAEDEIWEEAPDDEHIRTLVPRGRPGDSYATSNSLLAPVPSRGRGISSSSLLGCSGSSFEDPANEDFIRSQSRRRDKDGAANGDRGTGIGPLGVPALPTNGHPGLPTPPKNATTPAAAAAAAGAGRFAVCNRESEAPAPPPKDKTRTLKYYPPPHDEAEAKTVDVIDHGSEVLIVRRDPSPLRGSPSTSVLLGASPRVGQGAASKMSRLLGQQEQRRQQAPAAPQTGLPRSSMMQEPTLGRAATPAPGAPAQVQQAMPDADSPAAKSNDASL